MPCYKAKKKKKDCDNRKYYFSSRSFFFDSVGDDLNASHYKNLDGAPFFPPFFLLYLWIKDNKVYKGRSKFVWLI